MNYSDYITRLGQLMVLPVANAAAAAPFQDNNANAILPAIIDYAEQRMYREIDLLETTTTATTSLASNTRSVGVPGGFIVINQINIITPAGSTPDQAGAVRHPLRRVSNDFLSLAVPNGSQAAASGVPVFYANRNNTTILVGPAADAAYVAEFIGTIRPAPLSSANVTTILTTYLPDLFLVASMVQASGYQKNWSLKSDDPRMPVNWESQYQALVKTAQVEEQRKKAQSSGWQPYSPTPIATPPRQ